MTKTTSTPRTEKVRRRSAGGKPARGWEMQRAGRKVRRADVRKLRIGAPDARLTTVGGLVSFNAFAREQGLPGALRRRFGHLKTGPGVVYPMAAQMQLLLDASVAGAQRIFDLEMLAADPLFLHLAGGSVPSIDVLYDDLRRFDAQALEDLEALVAEHGTAALREHHHPELELDIDTTVTPLFGEQEGARPGPNPHYHGRPSYHPILARVAQTGTILGARLRPGDTGLGELDVEDIGQWVDRANERLSGSQAGLWEDLDFSVHVFATNDKAHDADTLARRYDDRAGIETVIAELKGGFGIGKVSTSSFDANEAGFLIKVLAFNLLRRWVQARHRPLASCRTAWLRRLCVQVPGRLLRSGGRWELRLAPRPMLT